MDLIYRINIHILVVLYGAHQFMTKIKDYIMFKKISSKEFNILKYAHTVENKVFFFIAMQMHANPKFTTFVDYKNVNLTQKMVNILFYVTNVEQMKTKEKN